MKLVKFSNDKYGIRSHWFFGWHFIDFDTSTRRTLRRSSKYFADCQTTEERAVTRLRNFTAKYEVIDPAKKLEGYL